MESKSQALIALTCLMFFLLAVSPPSEAAISCNDVMSDLRPCVNYLVNGTGMPPPACCAGASKLASTASTKADRQTACSCMKSAAQKLSPKAQLAQNLAKNCGINASYTFSTSVDCSKIT